MSKTVAQASAEYRKRRADKLARYEAALRDIAEPLSGIPIGDPWAFYADLQVVARNALEEVK